VSDSFLPGEAEKRDGMARAWDNANPYWRLWTIEACKEVCERKPYLTTDEIEMLRLLRNGPITHEKRALGPVMKICEGLGYCVPLDRWWPSDEVTNHRRPKRVWYSLIYRGRKVRRPRARKIIDPRQYELLDLLS